MSDATLGQLAAITFRDPDEAARAILARNWTADALWSGLVVVAAVSTLLTWVAVSLGGPSTVFSGPVVSSPLIAAGVQAALLWLMIQGVFRVGRGFGGTGTEEGAFALVVWLQGLLTVLQAAQLLLAGIPLLGTLLGLASLVLFFWWLVRFQMVLHGFDRPFAVLATTLLVMTAAIVTLAAVLGTLGLVVPPEAAA